MGIDIVPNGLVVMVQNTASKECLKYKTKCVKIRCVVNNKQMKVFDRVKIDIEISLKNYRKSIVLNFKLKLN